MIFEIIKIRLLSVQKSGYPTPGKTCDSVFTGKSGSSKGVLTSPNASKTELVKNWRGALVCSKSMIPMDYQSLMLKVRLTMNKCKRLNQNL